MLLLMLSLNITSVQNFIVKKTASILADKLKTKVAIQHIRIDFLNHLLLQGLYIEDKKGDTLLYAGEARVRITDWFLFKKEKPTLSYIGLHQAYAHLYRTKNSADWNYQFIIDAFGSNKKSTTKKQNDFEIDLRKIDIKDFRFHMDDAWVGNDLDIDVGNLQLDADELGIKKKKMDINSILIENANVASRDYAGGKPKTKRKPFVIDNSPFNTDGWQLTAKKITLHQSHFQHTATERPSTEGEFDPEHIVVQNINFDVKNIQIKGDTIRGKIVDLTAKERCGIVVKKFTADVTVSPNASICDHLFLQTNNSVLHHYYAMRYTRFPDFLDYIHKVVMVGKLDNSVVDSKDVAFFAPQLKNIPTIVHVSGEAKGTVDNLVGKNLYVTDGNTFIKGDISMKGLPDINTTFINYENGEIFTTNNGLYKYAPELKDNPNIAFDKLNYAYFNGNFSGYIENFATNGLIKTNLGDIQSNVKINMPDFNSKRFVYSGTVSTTHFDIGTLTRQDYLGAIAFNATLNGAAFDPQDADIHIKSFISNFEVKGYNYKNITAEGKLAKKKFDGNLLVDDPNLALAFYGSIDFNNKEMDINAKANLLQSNLKALNLTTDSVTAAADFDLNFVGNNIDNFFGYTKLYNINFFRNNHRLDVDSVHLNSSYVDGNKLITLESNDVTAKVEGNYQLTTLPHSIQFYISKYLPNYIAAPIKYSPDQNINFSVQTRNIDSLLAVLLPNVKGFDTVSINGNINTASQQLSLKASIPSGTINNISFDTVTIKSNGNFKELKLDADIKKIVLGKNILSASMIVNTTLGNDSLSFNIATNSPDALGTLNIGGNAFARGDSLYLKLQPSEFYLNQTKWEVPSGNRFVFSKNYLLIKDLFLKSGLQEISASTSNEMTTQSLNVNIKDLDISMLGGATGISNYQPDGRINGSFNMDHLFSDLLMSGELRATNVKLGTDTIGNINLIGSYDAKKKIINLDPQSGIFNGNASIRTAGNMSFDSTNDQLLDGYIQFSNANIHWITPFVSDYINNTTGTLNGTVNIAGSATKPNIDGNLILDNATTKINIIGTTYNIPSAKLKIDNNTIDFGNIAIYDAYNNRAILTGSITHDRFRDFSFNRVQISSHQFEVLNLKEYENTAFYGNLIADLESMTISGPFNNIRMNISASPAARSHIYIPVTNSADIGTYSYVSFKSYGKDQNLKKKNKNNFSLNIIGKMNPLAEMTLVLDPTSGDMINAKGNGTIQLVLPSNDDIKMYGNYEIDEGDYTFTLKQLAIRKNFKINSGSKIAFNGAMATTNLDINAIYNTRARLIDLLNSYEKNILSDNEIRDAKTAQDVNVMLHMTGSLYEPKLGFNIELPENRSEGTYAYLKLKSINQNDRELFDQVASLLLINNFIPPDGIGGTTAVTGAVNNISEIISTTASSQLTNIVNKILGDPKLSVELKYNNYNLSDPTYIGGVNRNEVSLGLRKSLLDDRLIVEVGSVYDWGKPTSSNSNTSNLNLAGDFRVQYLLTEDGRIRLSAFRTNNYDVLVDMNVWSGGLGISYRKTFNNFYEFLHKPKKIGPPADVPQSIKDSSETKGSF